MRGIRDRISELISEFSELDYSDIFFDNLIQDSITELEFSVTYNTEDGTINSTDTEINNQLYYYARIKTYEKVYDYYTDKAISVSDGAGSGDFTKRASLILNKLEKLKKDYDRKYYKRRRLYFQVVNTDE